MGPANSTIVNQSNYTICVVTFNNSDIIYPSYHSFFSIGPAQRILVDANPDVFGLKIGFIHGMTIENQGKKHFMSYHRLQAKNESVIYFLGIDSDAVRFKIESPNKEDVIYQASSKVREDNPDVLGAVKGILGEKDKATGSVSNPNDAIAALKSMEYSLTNSTHDKSKKKGYNSSSNNSSNNNDNNNNNSSSINNSNNYSSINSSSMNSNNNSDSNIKDNPEEDDDAVPVYNPFKAAKNKSKSSLGYNANNHPARLPVTADIYSAAPLAPNTHEPESERARIGGDILAQTRKYSNNNNKNKSNDNNNNNSNSNSNNNNDYDSNKNNNSNTSRQDRSDSSGSDFIDNFDSSSQFSYVSAPLSSLSTSTSQPVNPFKSGSILKQAMKASISLPSESSKKSTNASSSPSSSSSSSSSPPSSASASSYWTCESCTIKNYFSSSMCEACSSPRRHIIPAESADDEDNLNKFLHKDEDAIYSNNDDSIIQSNNDSPDSKQSTSLKSRDNPYSKDKQRKGNRGGNKLEVDVNNYRNDASIYNSQISSSNTANNTANKNNNTANNNISISSSSNTIITKTREAWALELEQAREEVRLEYEDKLELERSIYRAAVLHAARGPQSYNSKYRD